MERKLNLNTAVKWWQPEYQHSSVFSSLGRKGPGSKASKLSLKTSSSMMSRKREALALAQLKICQLKVRQRLDEEEHEIRRKRESMEAEMEAEKAAVSLKIYEEEEIGEEGRDMELVISHDKEHWQPPKLHGVTEPRGSSEPFTMDRTPSLKPQVPTIPSTTNYLNETVSGSFLPHPKREALVLPISSCNSAQPNGYATLQPVSHLSSCKQLRFTSSLDKPASESVSGVTASVTPTSNTVTSSLTVPVIQPWELQHTTSRLPSRDSKPLLVESVVSSIKSSQPLYEQPVKESWFSVWQMPQAQSSQNVTCNTTPAQQVQHFDSGREMVKAMRQVVSSPKVEYLKFDGDPFRYVSIIHNFETYLEEDNPDDSRWLQLLIQHCTGKAREVVESCENLPVSDGYRVAKETLRENFGKPQVIADAHIKKLLHLPSLKNVDGPSLLEFSRHLDNAHRTLTGMGTEYVADLNHMNTLRELTKRLPMLLRAKWTVCAGKIIVSDQRPKFGDFVKFIRERAKLVDNEFGYDMNSGPSKETILGWSKRIRANLPSTHQHS